MQGTIGANQRALEKYASEEETLRERLNKTKDELKDLREAEKTLKKAEGEIPLLTKQIQENNTHVESLTSDSADLNQEIASEFQPEIEKLSKIERPTEKELDALDKELKEHREQEKEFRRAETTIEAKITDYQSIEQSKVCPTCDRPADPQEFKEKIKAKLAEREQASQTVSKCERTIEHLEGLAKKLRAFNEAQEKLKDLRQHLKKNRERVKKNNREIKNLKKSREVLQKKLDKATEELRKLKSVSSRVNELNKAVESTQTQLNDVIGKVSAAKTTIGNLKGDVKRLKEEIGNKKKQKELGRKLNEYHMWLKDYFIPTLDNIEKHVMITINQEFNRHFQKWFTLLVEDPDKNSRVDEDFTPIVEQDGYEQPIDFLSGGEKTSVALAYRLALNSIVQKVSAGMKSNLLILDEPTDGFSKEQLFKVREILNELQCPQVVMVSHERELESFADHIFRVEKREGISGIEAT